MISSVVKKYHIAFWRLCFLTLLIMPLGIGYAKADMTNCMIPSTSKEPVNPPKSSPGNPIDCPPKDQRRDDISPRCIQQEAAKNPCFDVMPVQNKNNIDRIPEDVCYRDWPGRGNKNHNGLDYSIGKGESTIASADGVIEAAECAGGNGNYVKIRHEVTAPQKSNDGAIVPSSTTQCFYTLYLHLSAFGTNPATGRKWARGDKIKKGQSVGAVGGTGDCSGRDVFGAHLHFEMRTCNNAILNPFCPDLAGVCEEGAKPQSNTQPSYLLPIIPGGPGTTNTDAYDPNKCRDCNKNAAQCMLGNYTGTDMSQWATGGGGGGGQTGNLDPSVLNEQPAATGKCTYSNYQDSVKGCLFCDIFKVLFDTASTVAALAFAALTPSVALVVVIATAIWIAFTVLKYLSSMEVKEPRAMVKEILNKLFLVFFILVLLQFGPLELIKWTIEPIFNTGMNLALLTSTAGTPSCEKGAFDVLTMAEGGGLPEEMGLNILCVVKMIQDSLLRILSLGSTSLCIGFFEKSFWRIPIFPHFGYVLTGLGLWVSAILVLLIYPWLLVDCVLKLSVSTALIPTAIGAFAFNATRKYVTKVWEVFLNSMFTFVFLSIIIFILITMINQSLEGANIDDVIKRSDQSFESLLDAIGWWGVTFLKICFTLLLGWAVLGEGSSFADDFAGGMKFSQNIGSNVGTTMMSGAKGAGLAVGKGAAKAGKAAGKKVGNAIKEKANAAKLNRQSKRMEKDVAKGRAVKNADGSITKTHTDWRGRTVSQTMATGADGNKLMTKSTTDRKGNTTTTTTDKHMSATIKTNKDGKVYSEEFKMKAASAKNMLNKDGSVNQVAVNALMKNSMLNPDLVKKGMVDQMLKERFGPDKGLSKSFSDRQVDVGKDEKGNMTLSVVSKNHDGSVQKVNMTMGDKRAMLEMEEVDKKGNSSYRASDGIINKTRTMKYDKGGNVVPKSVKQNYSFTPHYTRSTRSIDSLGKFAKWVPKEEIMFSKEDIQGLTKQVAKYGRPQQTQGMEVRK